LDLADLVRPVERGRLVSRARRVARSPLLHFLLLGAILFAAHMSWDDREEAEVAPARREPIVFSEEQIRALEVGFAERFGSPPGPAQRRALIDQAVQEEMLYREARLLALDLGDASVRRRLIEKMRWVSDRPGRGGDELVQEALELRLDDDLVIRRLLVEKMRLLLQRDPGGTVVRDEDLLALLDRQGQELERPARVTLTQVFLGDARGDRLAEDAGETLARLRSRTVTADEAGELSDPFPLGGQLRAYSQLQLQARFGKPFAERVFVLEPGAWSEPIASPYGLHLVRVEEKHPARVPSLDEMRPTLVRVALRDRAQQNVARGLARLRTLYDVELPDSMGPAA
jgi:hypothetical protein